MNVNMQSGEVHTLHNAVLRPFLSIMYGDYRDQAIISHPTLCV